MTFVGPTSPPIASRREIYEPEKRTELSQTTMAGVFSFPFNVQPDLSTTVPKGGTPSLDRREKECKRDRPYT
ncbi:hypothetical protein KSZ_05850 [Dictyobacter formicarum]|uniref:Uncharacterized protein n=1 Tax=Dictyobacter formicarum TaxID=2778368 RepID=A0ABQ3V9Q8_9CHLR|nr:hypothetical protein KSZ_05850 [Dictyobacter formicarum]